MLRLALIVRAVDNMIMGGGVKLFADFIFYFDNMSTLYPPKSPTASLPFPNITIHHQDEIYLFGDPHNILVLRPQVGNGVRITRIYVIDKLGHIFNLEPPYCYYLKVLSQGTHYLPDVLHAVTPYYKCIKPHIPVMSSQMLCNLCISLCRCADIPNTL